MAKTNYTLNPDLYRRNGKRRPGRMCDRVRTYEYTDDVSKTDRNNREIITRKMTLYVENGIEPEKAAEILANNPKVKKAFEYLSNAGIDIANLFVELYTRALKRKEERNNSDNSIIR